MKTLFILFALFTSLSAFAQDENEVREGGFKKQNLFTGGGVTLSFSNNGTVLGASPVFGYSVAKWLDAGLVASFIYSSNRHVVYTNGSGGYFYSDDKLRQTTYGPGAFVRIFPVKFLFAQAQVEHNFINQKIIYANNAPDYKENFSATSFLVGGGYSSGREGIGNMFYYVSILFDIAKNRNSPYVEQTASGGVNVLPIIRAGIQVPLFQGKSLF